MKKIKIALGELRHNTIGRHSAYLPLAVGYIAAMVRESIGHELVDIRLYAEIEDIYNDFDTWQPDIIGFTNYCWNSNISYQIIKKAKEEFGTVTVMGGPEFPQKEEIQKREKYLRDREYLDFYVHGDGELAFLNIVKQYIELRDVDKIKESNPFGCCYLYKDDFVINELKERIKNMDEIPSPYLCGLFDDFLEKNYIPAIQVARGCPFKCAFCSEGVGKEIRRIGSFSVKRIKQELDYIVERVKSQTLGIYDSNWNLFEQDMEISEYIGQLIEKYDWPKIFEATTTRRSLDRTAEFIDLIKGRTGIALSLQSMNKETQKIMGRSDNLPVEEYLVWADFIRNKGTMPASELIIPMPKETKESFLETQKFLMENNIRATTYTLMMLKGTKITSDDFRKKYDLTTKFRILPGAFGKYDGKKCFEIEEVCCATDTMNFEDYLYCRGFAYLMELFSSPHLHVLRKLLNELKIDKFTFIRFIQDIVIGNREKKKENEIFSLPYKLFLQESEEELFDSEKEIENYFSKEENYQKLINREKGDNLIRKYVVEFFCIDSQRIFLSLKAILLDFVDSNNLNISKLTLTAIDEAFEWSSKVMSLSTIFFKPQDISKIYEEQYSFDLLKWFNANDKESILEFQQDTNYKVFYDEEFANSFREEYVALYGNDPKYVMGKSMFGRNQEQLWRQCEYK